MSLSQKQKLNARSSTEADLIGVDDTLVLMMWANYFIEAQGYTVSHNILYQDNKSIILLAKNGHMSGSSRTKHIKHRFYLVNRNLATDVYIPQFFDKLCGALSSFVNIRNQVVNP